MNEFFRTMMGKVFFEGTMPRLVKEIARLNDNLEKQRELTEKMFASQLERDALEDARVKECEEKYAAACASHS
jgi:hypothetical protein